MIKVFKNQFNWYLIIILSILYPLCFLFAYPLSMILSPDSISYINGSNMATPYFVSLINILMHIEGFFYKDKIVFLKYLTILIYAFAVFIISKSLYQNKKKYISVIIIPILWSVGFFTKYFIHFTLFKWSRRIPINIRT